MTSFAATTTDLQVEIINLKAMIGYLQVVVVVLCVLVFIHSLLVIGQVSVKVFESVRFRKSIKVLEDLLTRVDSNFDLILRYVAGVDRKAGQIVESAATIKKHGEKVEAAVEKVQMMAPIEGPTGEMIPVMKANPAVLVIQGDTPFPPENQ